MALQYGNWSIVRELGKGSFGTVYEIEKSEFGYVYRAALKVIHIPQGTADVEQVRSLGMSEKDITEYYQDIMTDCVREIVLMSKVQGHTNVVNYQAHEVHRQENGVGWDILIQMELLTPLNQYMAAHGMTRKDVVTLGISVCKALERCQKLGIIHRDIKPANIFVSDQGDFKLGDFGIARTAERTMSGMSRKGTYTYMAPEVYQGKAYNHQVDIYSLGLVLYRLLNNNREPFLPPYPQKIRYQDQEQSMIRRMRGDRLPPPGEERGKLAEIVLKACSFDPKDRYASPKEMREELEELLWQAKHPNQTMKLPVEPPVPVPPEPTVEPKTKPDETIWLWDEKQKVPEKEVEPEPKTEQEGNETISLWGERKKDLPEEQVDVTPREIKETVKKEDPRTEKIEFLIDLGIAVMLAAIVVIFLCIFRPWQASAKGSPAEKAETTTAQTTSEEQAETKTQKGMAGESITWKYVPESNTLRFNGSGEMRDYSSSDTPPWCNVVADNVRIEIEDGITSIGARAFKFLQIAEISIPDSVKKIGDCAFFHVDCVAIEIPENVTEIGNYALATHDRVDLWFQGDYSDGFSYNALSIVDYDSEYYDPEDYYNSAAIYVYYPEDNNTWTDEAKVKFNGNIIWNAV